MATFRAHFDLDGIPHTPALIAAATPEAARRLLASRHEGESIVIHKVKLDRDVPPRGGRVRRRHLPPAQPAKDIAP